MLLLVAIQFCKMVPSLTLFFGLPFDSYVTTQLFIPPKQKRVGKERGKANL